MRTFESSRVGLRDKDTGKLVAVFPEKVDGSMKEVQKAVFDWYYKKGCSAETELERCFVDSLTENELKSIE